MLFFGKRTQANQYSSAREAFISITGLILGSAIIGGLGALIFGLASGRSSGTIGGAIVLGVSVFLTFIFILAIVCCCKNNESHSNTDQEHPSHQRTHHRPEEHRKRIKSPPHLTVVTVIQKHDHKNELHTPSTPKELTDSIHSTSGKQLNTSPSRVTTFDMLNHSSSSINGPYRH